MSASRFLVAILACLPAVPAFADGPKTAAKKGEEPVSYYREVRRIFQQHCQGCHQPAKAQGGYVMTGHADLLKAGDRGVPGVVPGNASKSYLVEQIVPKDGKRAAMPKGKAPLAAHEIELIKR